MSERVQHLMKVTKPVGEVALAGAVAGFFGIAGITADDHRGETHRSLELHSFLKGAFRFEQRTLKIGNPQVWADVHRNHHRFADANLKGFLDAARAMNWMEENAAKVPNVFVPNYFGGLDPFVDKFTREEVQQIGDRAESYLKERMGNEYRPPEAYTEEELKDIFHSTKPKYFYPRTRHPKGAKYTQQDKERILLVDPHSPPLIPPPEHNGVRGVAINNISLYGETANMFRAHNELMSEDLRPKEGEKLGEASNLDVAAGFLIPAVGYFLYKGEYNPKGVLKAIVAGAAINGIRTGLEVFGGNVTNSLGHAGTLTDRALLKAIRDGVYKPEVNDDGTITTNTQDAGFLGRILAYLTFDEVGGQANHHNHPELIAYTLKEGIQAWQEAPWGKFLETMANNERFPLINPGKGFDLRPGETRPDMPDPALVWIHQIRADQKAGRRKLAA